MYECSCVCVCMRDFLVLLSLIVSAYFVLNADISHWQQNDVLFIVLPSSQVYMKRANKRVCSIKQTLSENGQNYANTKANVHTPYGLASQTN